MKWHQYIICLNMNQLRPFPVNEDNEDEIRIYLSFHSKLIQSKVLPLFQFRSHVRLFEFYKSKYWIIICSRTRIDSSNAIATTIRSIYIMKWKLFAAAAFSYVFLVQPLISRVINFCVLAIQSKKFLLCCSIYWRKRRRTTKLAKKPRA